MVEIKVWKNPQEKCWEVRVLVGNRLYGRLFHYKADAEQYMEELRTQGYQNELGDPGGLHFIKNVI